ncbi:MAG: SH3 domain-containing protein [Geminicoccaceae bacterium]
MRGPLVFLLAMLFSAGSAVSASGERWAIAGDNVNLRRGPGPAHEIKRQLSRNQNVIEQGQKGEWHHVEVVGANGLLGWVHRSLLQKSNETADSTLETQQPVGRPDLSPQSPVGVRKAFKDRSEPIPEPAIEVIDPDTVLEQMRGYVERREKLPKDPVTPRVRHSGREIIRPVPIRNPGDQSRIPTELVLASSTEVAGFNLEAMEHFRDSVSYLNSRAWSVAGIKLFSEIEPIGGGVVQVKTTDDWFEVPKIGQTSYLNTLVDRWSSAKADGAPAGVMLVDPKGSLLMHQTKP